MSEAGSIRRQTIFALSSGRVPSAIAVMRVSGPQSGAVLASLTRRALPPERRAVVRCLTAPDGEALDTAMVLWLPGPKTATGEDMAELHLHGSPAVVAGVSAVLARMEGVRPAEAGEFTRRAFDNGCLDLTEAEGLADLMAAETSQQRRQALRQMGGGLAQRYDSWRARLIRAMAHVEAVIDFPDEDVPDQASQAVVPELAALSDEIRGHLAEGRRGEIVRDGLSVVILGPPNAGKSSLLNALAKRDVAIVSPVPGTTRDLIEVSLNIDGHLVQVTDTAGLRESTDAIEAEGVARALARAERADVRLWVAGPGQSLIRDAGEALAGGTDILILSKRDLPGFDPSPAWLLTWPAVPVFAVSAVAGPEGPSDGLDGVLGALSAMADALTSGGEAAPLTRERHRLRLEECLEALGAALGHCPAALDLMAEELRRGAHNLGALTGRIDVEAVLDQLFREFCIGK